MHCSFQLYLTVHGYHNLMDSRPIAKTQHAGINSNLRCVYMEQGIREHRHKKYQSRVVLKRVISVYSLFTIPTVPLNPS